jgi:hypothetical protein
LELFVSLEYDCHGPRIEQSFGTIRPKLVIPRSAIPSLFLPTVTLGLGNSGQDCIACVGIARTFGMRTRIIVSVEWCLVQAVCNELGM